MAKTDDFLRRPTMGVIGKNLQASSVEEMIIWASNGDALFPSYISQISRCDFLGHTICSSAVPCLQLVVHEYPCVREYSSKHKFILPPSLNTHMFCIQFPIFDSNTTGELSQ